MRSAWLVQGITHTSTTTGAPTTQGFIVSRRPENKCRGQKGTCCFRARKQPCLSLRCCCLTPLSTLLLRRLLRDPSLLRAAAAGRRRRGARVVSKLKMRQRAGAAAEDGTARRVAVWEGAGEFGRPAHLSRG